MNKTGLVAGGMILAVAIAAPWVVGMVTEKQWHQVTAEVNASQPFVRLETSRNRQTGGTGLGLSITSDIILGHGGEMTLDDSPLGGLRVAIKLPV